MSQHRTRQSARNVRKKDTPIWPILIVLGGLGLVALAVWSFAGGGTGSKGKLEINGSPSLKVDRERVDLGNVRLGEWVTVSFDLANVGDQPLRFSEQPYIEVAAGC